jgi:outer membrane protein TolC
VKRFGTNIVAAALAVNLGAGVALAQEAVPTLRSVPAGTPIQTPSGAITLEKALSMAKKSNHGIAAEKAKLAQARTSLETAWSTLFPTVAAQGRYSRNYKPFIFTLFKQENGMTVIDPVTMMPIPDPLTIQPINQFDGSINATMPIIAPAAYPAINAVKANVEAAEANYEASEADIFVGVAQAYLAAAVADEVLAARASAIQVAKATLTNAQTRREAGTVTKVDVDRAELAVVRAEQNERDARNGRTRAYRTLGTLIGIQGEFAIQPEIPTAALPDARNLDMALHLRPEFAAIEASIVAAQKTARARAWQWAPTLSAFGNARVFNYDNFARDSYSWVVGGQLDWVLFDGGKRDADRHAANAQAAEGVARSLALRDRIRDDLANSSDQLEVNRRGVEAANRQVELARETLELVRVQYESGVGTQLDLLAAQDAIVIAHLGLAQAHFDVAAAELSLRHAAGTFPPKDLK